MFLLWAIPDVLELVQLMEGFETDEVGNMSYDYSGWLFGSGLRPTWRQPGILLRHMLKMPGMT